MDTKYVPEMMMLVGLPGSGKSTYAHQLIGGKIFSSDRLREEMFGDATDQSHNHEVFQELHKRIKEHLRRGNSAIYDACNISSKRRRAFLNELKNIECVKRCVIIATPYGQCLANNGKRESPVPEHVIERMYRNWDTPYWFEGWDEIEIEYWPGTEEFLDISNMITLYEDYDQSNPHHSLKLGGIDGHLNQTGINVVKESKRMGIPIEIYKDIECAGYLHDIGKPFCKTFKDAKGDIGDIAHYYNHEHVGAYNSLFYNCFVYDERNRIEKANPLDVSILINLHMRPYDWERDNNVKLENRCKKLWGDDIYCEVSILHRADKAAH